MYAKIVFLLAVSAFPCTDRMRHEEAFQLLFFPEAQEFSWPR